MKCQIPFFWKNKKKCHVCRLLNLPIAWSVLSVDAFGRYFCQGPVVQSIVSLMSSLMTNSLIVVAKVFSDTLIFLLQNCE